MTGLHETSNVAPRKSAEAGLVFPPMYPGGNRIGAEEGVKVARVIASKRLFRYYGVVDGPSEVDAFERTFISRFGVAHAVAVGSGTAALTAGLAALGVGPGDEVIVPTYTWIATPAAVLALGAVPVMADIDESLTLDPADVEARITERTRAIVPVHMRGAPADMDAIMALGTRHGIGILEDAAQALGATHRGRWLGTIGDVGAYSLQFNKMITCGEGGVVVSDDSVLYQRALMYHDVGVSKRAEIGSENALLGTNARLTEVQAAIAQVQLGRLDGIIADARRNHAALRDRMTDAVGASGAEFRTLATEGDDAGIAFVMYCPSAQDAARVVALASAAGTPVTRLYEPDKIDYHVVAHWSPVLHKRGWSATTPWDSAATDIDYSPGQWRRSLDLLARAVHVDISPDLGPEHIDRLAEVLIAALGQR